MFWTQKREEAVKEAAVAPYKLVLDSQTSHHASQMALMQKRIEELEDDKNKLLLSLEKMQNALVAAQSPEAYRDMKNAEWEAANPRPVPTSAEQEQAQKRKRGWEEYLRASESSLFARPEDLEDLQKTLMAQVNQTRDESLHGNSES